MRLRLATAEDIPLLTRLIERSVRALQSEDYTPAQIEGALGTIYGVDPQLVSDQTYFVMEDGEPPVLVACGGWSKRRTAFGSGDSPVKDDSLVDPAVDPARIRGFFVDPVYARRGLGTAILRACESAATEAGFRRFELTSTLTGVALYRRHGYQVVAELNLTLPNGEPYRCIRMARPAQNQQTSGSVSGQT